MTMRDMIREINLQYADENESAYNTASLGSERSLEELCLQEYKVCLRW